MRLLFSLISFVLATSGASAGSANVSSIDPTHDAHLALQRQAYSINEGNCYGAPIPPWEPACYPGWYYGRCQFAPAGLLCLVDGLLCFILDGLLGFHFCPVDPLPPPTGGGGTGTGGAVIPPPPNGYTYTFSNLTCAAVGCPTYLTFGMVETMADCAAMCNTVPKCKFVNSYYDRNSSKPPNLLTCSLFNDTRTVADATNCGGQQQLPKPAGLTRIEQSYGYGKPFATVKSP
ncbi:hypothetical protein C8F01DRAFT_1324405 [Mycena amicta]|nr:hypothetical protein C8F01DRAFT_1324405 [Mycena amicta]